MDNSTKELLLYQILSGQIECDLFGQKVYLVRPSVHALYKAQKIYVDVLEEYKKEGLWDLETSVKYMLDNGLWSINEQALVDGLPKKIDGLKVELYKNYLHFKRRDSIATQIGNLRQKLHDLSIKRNSYYSYTAEYSALQAKYDYLICAGTTDKSGQHILEDAYPHVSSDVLTKLKSEYWSNFIDPLSVRYLSQHEPWQTMWGTGHTGLPIFNKCVIDLTYDQQLLLIWSKFYDNIRESTDCPSEEVINNDDMLDGWILLKKQERKDNKDDKLGHLHKNANEVMIMVDNPDDVNRVHALNDKQGEMSRRSRFAVVQRKGVIAEQDMPDTKLQIAREVQQKLREKYHKK